MICDLGITMVQFEPCVEFACSPHACVIFLRVLWFPPTVQMLAD